VSFIIDIVYFLAHTFTIILADFHVTLCIDFETV